MHIRCLAVSLIFLSPWVAAEPATPDFGPGLQKLAALGLPEMKDAQWVKPAEWAGDDLRSSYEFQELGLKLQGGAWQLPGEPARQLGLGSGHVNESPAKEDAEKPEAPAAEPGLLQKMLRNHAASKPTKEKKPKAAPSLDEDVKRLLESLAKPEVVSEMAERAEYSRPEMPGRLLIFAAQLHAAGKYDAANRVAAAVFSAIPDKTVVIDAAIQHFAQRDHQKLTNSFFDDFNWKSYHDGLNSMLQKYPRGWQEAPAVSILIPGLEKRVSGAPLPPPSLPGIDLKPEAIAALAAFAEPPAAAGQASDEELARHHGVDLDEFPAQHRAAILAQLRQAGLSDEFGDRGDIGLWLLIERGDAKSANPASRLTAMGMDGLIAFAAVASDETLVPVRNQSSRSSYFSSSMSIEETALRRYEGLDRPASLGEIARRHLAAVVPSTEDDEGDIDESALQENAIAFWKNHRDKSLLQLAQVYLEEGSSSQRGQASSFLASSDDPASHAAFEKAVLAAEEPVAFASDVENYLDRRKAAAKPFFDAFSKHLSASLEGVDEDEIRYSSGSYAIREAGSVEKYLKTLSMKVGSVSLKELVADAMKSGEQSDIEDLKSAMQNSDIVDGLTSIGGVAAKANPGQMEQFCMLLLQRAYRDYDPDSGDGSDSIELPAATLDLWRPLLAKLEALQAESSFGSWATSYGAKTIGDGVALVLEVSAHPSSGSNFNSFGDIQGSLAAVAPFVRTRVEAWINGKDPLPWPDESKVSDARKEEIAGQFANLPAKEILAFAMALPLDERAALASLVSNYDEDNLAPAAVLELRTRVVARRAFNPQMPHDDALLDELGIAEGHEFSAASLAALTERLAKDAVKFSGTQVSFFPAPMNLGSIASASNATKPENKSDRSPLAVARYFQQFEDQEALAMLALSNTATFWGLKEGKVTQLEAPRPADESLKVAFESKSVELPYISVQVITRADADKLNQEDE